MAENIGFWPQEILTNIFTSVTRLDLKSARLVSRQWDSTAQRLLFHTFILKVNLNSFERLQDISNHARLRQHVRVITYDGRTINPDLARSGYSDWILSSAGSGLGLDYTASFVNQFSEKVLQQFFYNFCEYVFNQEYILRRGNEKAMLLDILKNLPALSDVRYAMAGDYDEIDDEVPSLSVLSPTASRILVEPENFPGMRPDSDGRFWSLLHAVCLSKNVEQLRKISGSDLDLNHWEDFGVLIGDCYKALRVIESLSLDFDLTTHSDGGVAVLADMISHTHSLRSLHLFFGVLSNHGQNNRLLHLPTIISANLRWKHLRSLSLDGLVTTEAFLRDLLRNHATSLRSLELADILLQQASPSDRYRHGSWLRIILFLNEFTSLDEVDFGGTLSNAWDEAWCICYNSLFEVSEPKDPQQDDRHNCLKYRIQRFIIMGGPCPFSAAAPGAAGINGLPWICVEDDSWQFNRRMLS